MYIHIFGGTSTRAHTRARAHTWPAAPSRTITPELRRVADTTSHPTACVEMTSEVPFVLQTVAVNKLCGERPRLVLVRADVRQAKPKIRRSAPQIIVA